MECGAIVSGEQQCYPLLELRVTGGVGGQFARTEDLELAARTLAEASGEVIYAGEYLRNAEHHADRAIPMAVEGVRSQVIEAHRALFDARVAVGGFDEIALELDDVSARLSAVARHFEQAESRAYQGVSRWTQVGRGLADWVGLGVWSQRVALGTMLRTSPLDWAMRLAGGEGIARSIRPVRLPRTTGLLNGATATTVAGALDNTYGAFGSAYDNVLWLLSRGTSFLEAWAGEPKYVGAESVGEATSVPQARGVADLVQDISDTAELGHSAVVIDTITHPDGSVSHVIHVPGTNDVTFSHASIRDWNSNFLLTDAELADAARMVRDAMQQAGIGPNDSIMISGHSQGGAVAAFVAADLADDYSITHVASYGSATDRIRVLENVQYLHVETGPDLVAAGDAKTPPDLPNVTRVEADLLGAANPELAALGGEAGAAHSLDAYHAVGQSIDASTDSSIQAWRDGAKDFFGDGDVTRQEFQPIFEEPGATVQPAASTGEVFGPPVPPPNLQAGQELRDALVANRDPVWSTLLDQDPKSGLSPVQEMHLTGGGAGQSRP